MDQNFLANLKQKHPTIRHAFYLQGAYDEEQMSFVDRTLCRLLRRNLKKKDRSQLKGWEIAMADSDGLKSDWTREDKLDPIKKIL